jgi:hypothetical protein
VTASWSPRQAKHRAYVAFSRILAAAAAKALRSLAAQLVQEAEVLQRMAREMLNEAARLDPLPPLYWADSERQEAPLAHRVGACHDRGPYMPTERGDLGAVISTKITDGRLPRDRPEKMWVGPGLDNVCDACGLLITRDQREYEFEPPGWRTIHLHHQCLEIWHVERVKLGPPIQGGSAGVEGSALRMAASLRHGFTSGYCVECLASRFEIPVHETREAAQVLVTRPGFRMVEGECYTCGRMNDVLLFGAGPSAPAN